MYDAGLIGDVQTKYMAGPTARSGRKALPTPTGKVSTFRKNWIGISGWAPLKNIDYNPAYMPFNWRGWWAFGTGALGDMACHIMDPIFRILPIDYPNSAECSVADIWNGHVDRSDNIRMVVLRRRSFI